jgi:polysaccharide biosynthesis protein VpsQ
MKTKIIAIGYILLVIAIIFIADHKTYHHIFDIIRSIPFGDKIGHFVLIGLLAFVVNVLFACKTIKLYRFRFLLGGLIVVLLVTLEEFSQLFIKVRTFDLGDLIADYLGILLFSYLAKYLRQKLSVRFKESS